MNKTKHHVTIKRLSRKHNNGFRYRIDVSCLSILGTDTTWAYTLWGARWAAKKLARKHDEVEPAPVNVEGYEL